MFSALVYIYIYIYILNILSETKKYDDFNFS